ncbi:MAG: excinuclease ABC subunit UvrA [Ferruginibacter sp.]
MSDNNFIVIKGARENNLKNVSINIPKKLITVFTGVSGSGKSSLVFDTIAAESQRQLNETFSAFIRHRLPHYGQPEADSIQNLSAAIIIDQKRIGGNARSTVGTITDIGPLLRLLFSRIGKPFIGYSNIFSFNHPDGMCLTCQGIGKVTTIDIEKLLDRNKSLNGGAIRFSTFKPGTALWKRYVFSGYFDNDKKLKDFSKKEWDLLLYQDEIAPKNPLPGWWASAKYEGVIPKFTRRFLGKEESNGKNSSDEILTQVVTQTVCPSCNGARLNSKIRSCRINGKSIADYAALQISELVNVVKSIEDKTAATMVSAITERLNHLISIGLNYLFLNRETSSLSGGESQRIKMVKHLGSSLTDMTYIFDEPSIGLHPKDVHQLNELLILLRDKGNTVLVVEHDPDVIAIADHIVDMGPKAGSNGGSVVFEGDLNGLKKSDGLTGKFLHQKSTLKNKLRSANGFLEIKNATLHNLKNVNTQIPKGIMTVVTGVAGSGKSSLINGVLPKKYPQIRCINQSAITGSKRSSPATYTNIFDPIRALFAKENKVSASLFSSNAEGACPECKGIGTITLELAFMDPITTVCELCNGKRFSQNVLQYRLRGKNIYEVLKLTVAEANVFFHEPDIQSVLVKLNEVGLDYITLGQPLNSLSGGERQRIKLASELDNAGQLYVIDEPTTGLHMSDVDRLLSIMNKMVDNGSTLIVIEHNLEVISQADWIIDMGPGAGNEGGEIMFEGTPQELIKHRTSSTGIFLKKYLNRVN